MALLRGFHAKIQFHPKPAVPHCFSFPKRNDSCRIARDEPIAWRVRSSVAANRGRLPGGKKGFQAAKSAAVCFAALAWFAVPALAGHKKDSQAAVVKLVSHGNVLLKTNKLRGAMAAYRKANKLSHHACFECFLGIASVEQRTDDLYDARREVKRALKVAQGNKQAAQAYLMHAVLSSEMASGPRDGRLSQAASDFRQALRLDPTLSRAKFGLGVVLLREKHDAEGVAELKAYLAGAGTVPGIAKIARNDIANPDRAREPFIPSFSATTLSGNKITNDSFAGKVVLFDFWATWCEPCRRAAPMIAGIYKKYSGRPVEIVGISVDTNRQAWKAFVVKHHMDWPQVNDRNGRLQEAFWVNLFPTYIVADRSGVVRYRNIGLRSLTENYLMLEIDQSLKQPYSPARRARNAGR